MSFLPGSCRSWPSWPSTCLLSPILLALSGWHLISTREFTKGAGIKGGADTASPARDSRQSHTAPQLPQVTQGTPDVAGVSKSIPPCTLLSKLCLVTGTKGQIRNSFCPPGAGGAQDPVYGCDLSVTRAWPLHSGCPGCALPSTICFCAGVSGALHGRVYSGRRVDAEEGTGHEGRKLAATPPPFHAKRPADVGGGRARAAPRFRAGLCRLHGCL